MLQTIRDYFSGIFSWIIIAMIGVPFALWGINQYTDKGGKASDVALVNGEGISQPDFLRASQHPPVSGSAASKSIKQSSKKEW
jgi:peptidyl-prolyl cis-trans isomerase D